MDKKGRTSVPARFRAQYASDASESVVITTGLDPCLVVYSLREWEAFERRLAELPTFDPSVSLLRRVYVSGAIDCAIDALGRVLVPQALRKHADLKKDVLWAGMGRHAELWSPARFESVRRSVVDDEDSRQAVVRRLAELGL